MPLYNSICDSISSSLIHLTSDPLDLHQEMRINVWLVYVILVVFVILLCSKFIHFTTNKTKYRLSKDGTSTEDCGSKIGNNLGYNNFQCHHCCAVSQNQLQQMIKDVLSAELNCLFKSEKNSINNVSIDQPSASVNDNELQKISGEIQDLKDEVVWQAGIYTHFLEEILDGIQQEVVPKKFSKIKVDELDISKRRKSLKTTPLIVTDDDLLSSEDSECESVEECEMGGNKCCKNKVKFAGILKQKSEGIKDSHSVNLTPILVADKKIDKSKKKSKSKSKETPLPEPTKEKITQVTTVEEFQEQLKEIKKQLKEQKEAMQQLTVEEKNLSRGDLEKKWQEDRYIKRFGPREDTPLTQEEQTMDRSMLYKKLMQERRDKWLKYQRDNGIKVYQCEVCGRYEKEGIDHVCLRGQYKGPLQRRSGVPVHRQMVVESSGSRLNIRQQPVIDFERLQKEHAAMSKTLEELAKVQTMVKPVEGISNNSSMEDVTQSQHKEITISQPSTVAAVSVNRPTFC